MCEIVIEGEAGAVEDAKVRVLVMLDELVSISLLELHTCTESISSADLFLSA